MDNAVNVGLVQWCSAGCLAAVVVQGSGACTGAHAASAAPQWRTPELWAWCSGAALAALQPWSFRVQVHALVHMLLPQHFNGTCRNCGRTAWCSGAMLAVLQRWSFRIQVENAVTVGLVQWCNAGC